MRLGNQIFSQPPFRRLPSRVSDTFLFKPIRNESSFSSSCNSRSATIVECRECRAFRALFFARFLRAPMQNDMCARSVKRKNTVTEVFVVNFSRHEEFPAHCLAAYVPIHRFTAIRLSEAAS